MLIKSQRAVTEKKEWHHFHIYKSKPSEDSSGAASNCQARMTKPKTREREKVPIKRKNQRVVPVVPFKSEPIKPCSDSCRFAQEIMRKMKGAQPANAASRYPLKPGNHKHHFGEFCVCVTAVAWPPSRERSAV